MSKEQSIAILNKLQFVVTAETDEEVYLNSIGEEHEGISIIQVRLYPNENNYYLLDIGGYYNAPIIGYERELINYLNRFHPGWDHLVN